MRRGLITPGSGSGLRRGEQGFSLIELLGAAVIAIILALFLLPYTSEVMDRVKESRAERDLREIQVALERFYTDHGHYPDKLAYLIEYPEKNPTHAYLKHTTKFRSPYSTAARPIYYFYAVNDNAPGTSRAYVLADPGPRPAAELRLQRKGPDGIPNGFDPLQRVSSPEQGDDNSPTFPVAFAWSSSIDDERLLKLNGNTVKCPHEDGSEAKPVWYAERTRTLRAYRCPQTSPPVRTEG